MRSIELVEYDSEEIRKKAYPNGQVLNFKKIRLATSELYSSKTYRHSLKMCYIEASEDYEPSIENSMFLEPVGFVIVPMFGRGCKFLPFGFNREIETFYYSDDLDNFIFSAKKDGRNFKVIHEEAIDILKNQPLYSYLDIKVEE